MIQINWSQALQQAGNNSHMNEITSIISEINNTVVFLYDFPSKMCII